MGFFIPILRKGRLPSRGAVSPLGSFPASNPPTEGTRRVPLLLLLGLLLVMFEGNGHPKRPVQMSTERCELRALLGVEMEAAHRRRARRSNTLFSLPSTDISTRWEEQSRRCRRGVLGQTRSAVETRCRCCRREMRVVTSGKKGGLRHYFGMRRRG